MKLIEAHMIGDELCPVTCTECGAEVPFAVAMSAQPEQECATAFLCLECLEKAMHLLLEHEAGEFNSNYLAAYASLDDSQKKDIADKFVAFMESAK